MSFSRTSLYHGKGKTNMLGSLRLVQFSALKSLTSFTGTLKPAHLASTKGFQHISSFFFVSKYASYSLDYFNT